MQKSNGGGGTISSRNIPQESDTNFNINLNTLSQSIMMSSISIDLLMYIVVQSNVMRAFLRCQWLEAVSSFSLFAPISRLLIFVDQCHVYTK